MTFRMPLSRTQAGPAIKKERQDNARSYKPRGFEGTPLEIVFPASRRATATFVGHTTQGALPMRSKALESWPESCPEECCLCLHCGEAITGAPLPAANNKEMGRYWVFGQFCRPCCVLGYVLEHWGEAGASRCVVWTREMLSTVFGVQRGFEPSPPRFMLKKYGGSLSLEEFYGTDQLATRYVAMRAPPMASFAMYMECVRGTLLAPNVAEIPTLESLRDLRRPLIRNEPLAERLPTGRAPLLLELLATKFTELTQDKEDENIKQVSKSRGRKAKAGAGVPAESLLDSGCIVSEAVREVGSEDKVKTPAEGTLLKKRGRSKAKPSGSLKEPSDTGPGLAGLQGLQALKGLKGLMEQKTQSKDLGELKELNEPRGLNQYVHTR